MTAADNTRYLAQANAQRRQATLARAQAAISQLDRDGQPVTFCSVSRAAGVSRAWLYRENDIHAAIVSLRTACPQATPGVPANVTGRLAKVELPQGGSITCPSHGDRC